MLVYNKKWLDFITYNRTTKEKCIQYDLIFDRMADSRGETLVNAIRDYICGIKTPEETLAIARFRDQNVNQYCFKTIEALDIIKRTKYEEAYKLSGKPKTKRWYKVEVK